MKKYKVTNKISGEKYELKINMKIGKAYVTDCDGYTEWETTQRDDETMDKFINRAKEMLKNDEDM